MKWLDWSYSGPDSTLGLYVGSVELNFRIVLPQSVSCRMMDTRKHIYDTDMIYFQLKFCCRTEVIMRVIWNWAQFYQALLFIVYRLNMPHDDDPKCVRFRDGYKVHNVMSRMLDHKAYPWAWSNCSRHVLTEFLE